MAPLAWNVHSLTFLADKEDMSFLQQAFLNKNKLRFSIESERQAGSR